MKVYAIWNEMGGDEEAWNVYPDGDISHGATVAVALYESSEKAGDVVGALEGRYGFTCTVWEFYLPDFPSAAFEPNRLKKVE